MLISFFLMIIISTSLTVTAHPSPRFHIEAWLPFRNCEMDYWPCILVSPNLKSQQRIYTKHIIFAINKSVL